MRRLLVAIVYFVVGLPAAFAETVSVGMDATYTGPWETAGSGTYVEDAYGDRHRVAVRVDANGIMVGLDWDNPADREIDLSVDWDDAVPRARRFVARAWCYNGGPWEANHQYAIGERVAVGTPGGTDGMILAARRTGDLSALSTWSYFTKGSAVIDNGDGTVSIPTVEHTFAVGDTVALHKMGPYDGVYTLPAQGSTTALTITATYTEYTVPNDDTHPNVRMVAGTSGATVPVWPPGKVITLGGSAVDDLDTYTYSDPVAFAAGTTPTNHWDGSVSLPCPAHGLTAGDLVVISGTINYDGVHAVYASSTADAVRFVAPWVSETFTGSETWQGRAYTTTHTISLPCPAHGFVEGDQVYIQANSVYDGLHVLPAQPDPDQLRITATYTAFTVSGSARAMRYYTVDNGITWEVQSIWLNLPSMQSYPSNRVIMRGQAGESGSIGQSGVKFHLGGGN